MRSLSKGTFIELCLTLLFTVFFVYGFIIFLIPVFTKILNIGNIVGMIICAILEIITIFHRLFFRLVEYMWHNSILKAVLIFVAAVVMVLAFTVTVFSVKMVKASRNYPDKTTTVIILGCRVKGYTPSSMLAYRTLAPVKYLKAYPDAKVIVSGGQGTGEMISEAECMKRILIENGISNDRIYIENNSTSTKQNIEYSYDIIKDNNLCTDVTISTSEFHHYRTSLIAGKAGIKNIYGISSSTLDVLLPTYWVREWFGIVYELLL